MDIIDDLRSLRNRLIQGIAGAAGGAKGWNDDIETLDRAMEEIKNPRRDAWRHAQKLAND